jgi:hypothetical protein
MAQTWFAKGRFVATLDWGPFFRSGLLNEASSMWGHATTGGGAASYQIARAPEFLVLETVRVLGGSPVLAERLFFGGVMAALAAAGVWFTRSIVRSPTASAIAGVLTVCNPFVLQYLVNPSPLPFWMGAVAGFSAGLVFRAARGKAIPPFLLGLVSVFAVYLSFNPPLLAVAAIAPALAILVSRTWGRHAFRRAFSFVLRAVPWAIALNLWWLVPYAHALLNNGIGQSVVAETNVTSWSWTHVRSSMANVLTLSSHWAWNRPDYVPFSKRVDRPILSGFRYALPALVFAAPMIARGRTRRLALGLVGGALVIIFLGKGLHSPLGDFNLALYRSVPGMWLLRAPLSKLGPLLVLIYVALAAITVQRVARLSTALPTRRHSVALACTVGLLVAAFVYPYPLWNGSLYHDDRSPFPPFQVKVPTAWQSVAHDINDSPVDGKVLVLPLTDFYMIPTTWDYYGVDIVPQFMVSRPTIQLHRSGYFGDLHGYTTRVREVQVALQMGRTDAVPGLLRRLGVSHVVLRKDINYASKARRVRMLRPSQLEPSLQAVGSLRRTSATAVADVFEVQTGSSGWVDRAPASSTVLRPASFISRTSDALDCRQVDARSKQVAGIDARPIGDDPLAVRVSAAAHSGCVGAEVDPLVAGGVYRVRIEYRTVQGRPARTCLLQAGPNTCAHLPLMDPSPGWHTLDSRALVGPDTRLLRLYVYADGPAANGPPTVTEYRNASVAYEDPAAPGAEATSTPVKWQRVSAAEFRATVPRVAQQTTLVLKESWAPGWRLRGISGARHVTTLDYANGWVLPAGSGGSVTIDYKPDQWGRLARAGSAGSLLVLDVLLLLPLLRAQLSRRQVRKKLRVSATSPSAAEPARSTTSTARAARSDRTRA